MPDQKQLLKKLAASPDEKLRETGCGGLASM